MGDLFAQTYSGVEALCGDINKPTLHIDLDLHV